MGGVTHRGPAPNPTQSNPTERETTMSYNTSTTSDIDIRAIQDSDDAEAVIRKYVATENGWKPNDLLPITKLAVEAAMADPRYDHTVKSDVEGKMDNIQAQIKEMCVGKATRLAPNDEIVLLQDKGWRMPHYYHPTANRIRFARILSSSRSYIKGEREAMAVFFDSTLAAPKWRTTNHHGEVVVPDQFDPSAYTHVVRWFGSATAAKAHAVELKRAIEVALRHTDDTALEDDPIRTLDMDYGQVQRDEYGF